MKGKREGSVDVYSPKHPTAISALKAHRSRLSARSLVQVGEWQVFWLVSQKAPSRVCTQWHPAFCLQTCVRLKLTAAGTAPDLHRCSLLMLSRKESNQLPGERYYDKIYLDKYFK